MNEEILLDFFNYVSQDKVIISSKDIENLEQFIANSGFEDIQEELIEFLNDFVYWSFHKLEINMNLVDDRNLDKIAISKLKSISDKQRSNSINSYKMLYKKNLEFNRIKNSEVRKTFRNLIKSKQIDFQVTYEVFKDYFKNNSSYKEIVLKFLTRLQTIIINQHLFLRQNSVNNLPQITKKHVKKKSDKIYTGEGSIEVACSTANKTVDNLHTKGSKYKSEVFNKSDEENLDSTPRVNNNGEMKSSLSDNELSRKRKENFLKVLKDITKNMITEFENDGKVVKLKLDTGTNEIVNASKKDDDYRFTFNNEENKEQRNIERNDLGKENNNIVKESDVVLNITDQQKNFDRITHPKREESKQTKEKESPKDSFSNKKRENDINPKNIKAERIVNNSKESKLNKNAKKGSKCNCLVY